jgi:hypothetical protein
MAQAWSGGVTGSLRSISIEGRGPRSGLRRTQSPLSPCNMRLPANGVFQMQRVDRAHQDQIGSRNRARQIVDAAPTDPRNVRLPAKRQIAMTVDHRFALRSPAFRARRTKTVLQRQFPDRRLASSRRSAGAGAAVFASPPNTPAAPRGLIAPLPIRSKFHLSDKSSFPLPALCALTKAWPASTSSAG